VRASSHIERNWLDSLGNAEPQLHPTTHHPRGAPHRFDEDRVKSLILSWQADQRPELLNQILVLAQPVLSGVILSRGSNATDFDETISDLRIRLWKKLPHFDHTKGRIYTYLTLTAHQAVSEIWARRRLYQSRYAMSSIDMLGQHQYATEPGVRQNEKLDEAVWKIHQIKTTCVDEHELAAQRWLIDGMVAAEFGLFRHQAADSMSIVFNLSPQRSRMLYDLTLLEVRRSLLDTVEVPKTTRKDLAGTRGRALAKYCDQLSPPEFSRLAFLMKNLAPIIIPKTDRVDLILDGFPDAQPLFPREFGSRVEQ
jgi:Sigma-70 region 2